MRNPTLPRLTSQGLELDTSTGSFGPLRSSMDVIEDASALRERMAEDGYLYLPDYVDRELVLRARESVTERLAAEGLTDPDYSADVGHTDHDHVPVPATFLAGRHYLRQPEGLRA